MGGVLEGKDLIMIGREGGCGGGGVLEGERFQKE